VDDDPMPLLRQVVASFRVVSILIRSPSGDRSRLAADHVGLSSEGIQDIPGIVRPLAALADIAYVATNTNERSADPLLIAEEFAVLDEPVLLFDSVAEALEAALTVADETDLIVVTGSLYTVADAHRALGEPF